MIEAKRLTLAALPLRIRNSLSSRLETRRWKSHEARKEKHLREFRETPAGPIFIFGCQRSGTTHVERLFRADPRSRVFGEFSALSVTPDHTVWQGRAAMQHILAEQPGAYWVIRSLLASHSIVDILNDWPESTAIWIFRDANSVVDSMIRKWQGDFRIVSERVETDLSGQWALRGQWDEIEAEAKALAPEAEGEAHWRNLYALFWLARNQLVVDLDLPGHPRVLLSDYADFTRAPDRWLSVLLGRAGLSASAASYPLETRPAARDTSHKPRFSPEIQARCDALYTVLCDAARSDRDLVGGT